MIFYLLTTSLERDLQLGYSSFEQVQVVIYIYLQPVTEAANLEAIRQMIGICPQKDVIVQRVTVREHLELYAKMKGVPEEEIPARVSSSLYPTSQ